jgi:hypothetical protein
MRFLAGQCKVGFAFKLPIINDFATLRDILQHYAEVAKSHPKSGASANFATSARKPVYNGLEFWRF